jgi:urease accessory protein
MRRTLGLSALLVLAAAPAFAHGGHGTSGFLHPLSGLDHVAAMVGVGLWAALLGSRRPAARLAVPAAFLVLMAAGAAAGFAGIKLPLVEAAIAASVFALGVLIIGAVRMPLAWAMGVVGLFALFHGYAHAVEAPAEATGSYILGFLAASALLQGLGLGLGMLVRKAAGDFGMRAMGGAVVAAGAVALIAQ